MSAAGGPARALLRGREAGCHAVQLFLKSQLRWRARPLAPEEVEEFRRARAATRIRHVLAHAGYLINLAAPEPGARARAVAALGDEVDRAERLGIPLVVVHAGSHRGRGAAEAPARAADALDAVLARRPRGRVRVALENTPGAGGQVGARLEDLGAILARVARPERVGVCLDTCHLFAAGYDIRTARGLAATLAAADRAFGLGRVLAFHLNDARAGLGSGLDRHEHPGRGRIGLAPFRALVRARRFRGVPMVLETPKDGDGDRRNLALLRRLRGGAGR
jgi:deoxyribonuclease-4